MKKFAFFLPQFYETKENNEWWGNGFTDWSMVKNARPLFNGHKQPIEPLDDNYYNMTNIETIKWQTSLMHKYNIDGLIYYHYYYEGKLLLEKPVDILLNNKDIDQPFFFCWANHSWTRAWVKSKETLIEQTYGDKEDWENHFQYLLKFFKDDRYEKIDNMPLFMIYQSDFDCRDEMYEYFNERCIDEGFNGLYIIETFLDGEYNWPFDFEKKMSNMSKYTRNIFLREPNTSLNIYNSLLKYKPIKAFNKVKKILYSMFNTKLPSVYSANTLYNIIMKNEPISNKVIHGIFFEWDNTPRYSERGYIIMPSKKEKFYEMMNHFKNEEYIFINAWNEWSEGTQIEPTKANRYKYLELLSKIK